MIIDLTRHQKKIRIIHLPSNIFLVFSAMLLEVYHPQFLLVTIRSMQDLLRPMPPNVNDEAILTLPDARIAFSEITITNSNGQEMSSQHDVKKRQKNGVIVRNRQELDERQIKIHGGEMRIFRVPHLL